MTRLDAEELLQDGARLRALARDLVHGAADVDDLVQETWLRALAKARRDGFSPRAWFGGLLRNVARERRRADARRAMHEHAASPAGTSPDDPAEVAARFDSLRRVLAFVDELGEPQRTTLIRRYVEGLEPVEIARREGVPDATVRSRIKRGLEEVRARLDAERGGDRAAWMAALLPWSPPVAAAATATGIGGLAMKWIVPTAAAALVIAGIAVVAARPRVERDDSKTVAARPRHGPDSVPSMSPAVPAETAARIADSPPAPDETVATADRRRDGSSPKTGWRLEGRLIGLDPATPWTGTIRIEPIVDFQPLSDTSQRVEAPLVDGRFAADLVPPARAPGSSAPWRAWQVTASDPAYVDVRTLVDVLDDRGAPRAPCTLHVELTTRRSARIHGRVVDEAGAPVPSIGVGWRGSEDDDNGWLEEQTTRTDAAGRYSLESPRTAPTYVTTLADEEKPSDLLAAMIRIDLHAGADVEAPDLVMRRGVTIHGLVVDRAGDPDPGATVTAIPVWTPAEIAEPTTQFDSCRNATADRNGEFELRGLRRGRWRLSIAGRAGLIAHPTVGNSLLARAIEVDAPAEGIELEDRLCRVELRLRIHGLVAKRTRFLLHGESLDRRSSSDLGAQTDDAGTFTFVAMPGAPLNVHCDLPSVEPTPQPLETTTSDRRRIFEVDFEARRPRASLALALHDPAGGSVSRAWIRLEPVSDPKLGAKEARPDPADGVFVVEDVDPGRYRAIVRAGGGHFGGGGFFEEETFDVDLATPSRVERSIPLRPTGRLRVYAVDADGKRVRADVAVLDEAGRRIGVGLTFEDAFSATFSPGSTHEKPAFLVPPPPPGRYRVEFTADGFFPKNVEAEVVRGETTDVAVTLLRR